MSWCNITDHINIHFFLMGFKHQSGAVLLDQCTWRKVCNQRSTLWLNGSQSSVMKPKLRHWNRSADTLISANWKIVSCDWNLFLCQFCWWKSKGLKLFCVCSFRNHSEFGLCQHFYEFLLDSTLIFMFSRHTQAPPPPLCRLALILFQCMYVVFIVANPS